MSTGAAVALFGSGLSAPAISAASASMAATTVNALETVTCSPSSPISGGPARNAQYPMDATTLTRVAAAAGSSDAALIPTGNPSEVPSPQSKAPTKQSQVTGAKMKISRPTVASSASARTTGTRPNRSSSSVPNQRARVIAARNVAKPSVPAAAAVPRSSISATAIQSCPVPSANANAKTNSPISSVRGSFHLVSRPAVRPGLAAGFGLLRGMVGVRQEIAHRERDDDHHGDRDGHQVGGHRDVQENHGRADGGAADRAHRIAGMEPGHDRPAHAPLDIGTLDVHRDVPCAIAESDQQQSDEHRDDTEQVADGRGGQTDRRAGPTSP